MCVGSLAGVTYLRCTVLTSSNKSETAVHCCDPALTVRVMLVSRNVFHVVSALQSIVGSCSYTDLLLCFYEAYIWIISICSSIKSKSSAYIFQSSEHFCGCTLYVSCMKWDRDYPPYHPCWFFWPFLRAAFPSTFTNPYQPHASVFHHACKEICNLDLDSFWIKHPEI